jgi:tetratricopeptide (TPR) repeat protein
MSSHGSEPSATQTTPPPAPQDFGPDFAAAGPSEGDAVPIIPLDTAAGFSPSATVTAAPSRREGANEAKSWSEALRGLPSRRSVVSPPSTKRRSVPEETVAGGAPPSAPRDSVPNETLAYDGEKPPTTISLPGRAHRDKRGAEGHGPDTAPEPDFVLREKIGSGGQGEVWRAWQTTLAREVAVKRLKPNGDVREFLMEAFTTAELDHPNIAPVHDLGCVELEGEEAPLIAMKFVRGAPWSDLLVKEREAPGFVFENFLARHLRILADVCDAVAYAHAKRIIHRDLKPQQVIVGEFGEVYLVDWGLAVGLDEEASLPRARHGVPRRLTLKTATNQTGTPAYMAPEQTDTSAEKLGLHTDIYLLGATLFEVAAGYPPHAGDSATDAYRAARKNILRPLSDRCPPELAETINKALATEPRKRHQTVAEFRAELDAFLSGSGRRAESREIAAEVAARLKEAGPDPAATLHYADLTRLRARLDRALQLWPENPEAIALKNRAVSAHASRALAEGDLRLAASLAESLPDDFPDRASLLERVEAARRLAARERRQRVVALVACVLLLTALAAGGALFALHQQKSKQRLADANAQLQQERDAAERARSDAEDARGRAEELLDFMLYDLRDGLQPIGRLDLLEKVAIKSLSYYEKRVEGGENASDEALVTGYSALSNVARVLGSQGRFKESREARLKVLEIAQRLLERDPESTIRQGGVAEVLYYLAEIEADLEDPPLKALEWNEKAEKAYRELVAAQPEEDSWLVALADTRVQASQFLGRFEDASAEKIEAALREALTVFEPREQKNLEDEGIATSAYQAHGKLAEHLNMVGRPADALEPAQAAVATVRRMREHYPDDAYWMVAVANAGSSLGQTLAQLDRLEEALKAYEEAAAILRPLLQRDPTNLQWTISAMSVLDALATIHDEADRPAEALPYHRQAIEAADGFRQLAGAGRGAHMTPYLAQKYLAGASSAYNAKLYAEGLEFTAQGIELTRQGRASGNSGGVYAADAYLGTLYYYDACFKALRGETEAAFEPLERLPEEPFGQGAWEGVRKDADLEPLRQGYPDRWAALMARADAAIAALEAKQAAEAEEEAAASEGEGEAEGEDASSQEEASEEVNAPEE